MEISVGMGEIKIAESPHVLKAIGLGSCIAVTLYDGETKIGGMAHILLPTIEEVCNKSCPPRFVDVAIGMMIDEMNKGGADIKAIKAKIFGGANMFPGIISSDGLMDVGKRNILAAKEELERFQIKITAEEVGDHIGRTVLFDTSNGSAVVKTTLMTERRYA